MPLYGEISPPPATTRTSRGGARSTVTPDRKAASHGGFRTHRFDKRQPAGRRREPPDRRACRPTSENGEASSSRPSSPTRPTVARQARQLTERPTRRGHSSVRPAGLSQLAKSDVDVAEVRPARKGTGNGTLEVPALPTNGNDDTRILGRIEEGRKGGRAASLREDAHKAWAHCAGDGSEDDQRFAREHVVVWSDDPRQRGDRLSLVDRCRGPLGRGVVASVPAASLRRRPSVSSASALSRPRPESSQPSCPSPMPSPTKTIGGELRQTAWCRARQSTYATRR